MTIFSAALHKGLAVGLVLEGGIGLAPFAITRNPIPLEIAEMGVNGPAHRPAHLRSSRAPLLRIEPDHPGRPAALETGPRNLFASPPPYSTEERRPRPSHLGHAR
ncbi:hypothetical protein [Bradyrhizobium sp. CSA112]|uniref:hypothetical protein n=1 Tax=Bradyrhizobium sp. CSA112 TaxID=2699170 RepID=UPI0023AF7823|nr:hypothetical protein [Bradyrhizobium sp. CSA112]